MTKSRKTTPALGPLVREARSQAGLTQVELAEKSGVPQSWISRIESGVGEKQWQAFMAIAKALALIEIRASA